MDNVEDLPEYPDGIDEASQKKFLIMSMIG
jgi:hypothetical protein